MTEFKLSLREIVNEIGDIDLATDVTEENEEAFYQAVQMYMTYSDGQKVQLFLPFGSRDSDAETGVMRAGEMVHQDVKQQSLEVNFKLENGHIGGFAVDLSTLGDDQWIFEEFCVNTMFLLSKFDNFDTKVLEERSKQGFFSTHQFSEQFFFVFRKSEVEETGVVEEK